MKILNYGSLNIDMVFHVQRIVQKGETIACHHFYKSVGGKGLNQSVALARAGACVFHAGKIGDDGSFLKLFLQNSCVDTRFINISDVPSGNALIQVDNNGQNSIIVYAGANETQLHSEIDLALSFFSEGDFLILQNEINELEYIINRASEKKMKIVLNPSPIRENLTHHLLSKVSWFILNDIEGKALTLKTMPTEIIKEMAELYPHSSFVLTLGENGSMCYENGEILQCKAFKTNVVDTTAAGDTFTGYFIAMLTSGCDNQQALKFASQAASITVSRNGAASSIPLLNEVENCNL